MSRELIGNMDATPQNLQSRLTSPASLAEESDAHVTSKFEAAGAGGSKTMPRLVYLLSCYPAVSHTFLLNEILALRKLGFFIDVASINETDRSPSTTSPIEAQEINNTLYVKSTGAWKTAWIAAKTLVVRPQVLFRGVVASLRMAQWDLGALVYAFFYFAEALVLGEWMRRRGHDHLHIHFGGPVATVGMLTAIAWRVPYSLTVHGPDEFYDVEKFYLREKIERAQLILCISNFCRSQLMRIASPVHWDKMHVVRLGIDPAVFYPIHEDCPAHRKIEIICVGRLVPSKGQLILLHACAELVAKGHSLRVRMVGGGPDRDNLQAFAAANGLEVILDGPKSHEETRQILRHADIFALASFAEGVPVALMEAMAMEIPCVSTNIAGIPELIRDGLDGLLVPASSVDALTSALQRLIEDPPLRRSLAVSGARRVAELYNLPQNARTLANVFMQHLRSQESSRVSGENR